MSTDTIILNLFDLGLKPYYPLDKDFTSTFQVKCAFFYGDRDWMGRICGKGPKQIVKESGNQITFDIINDSGHHVEICNPQDLVSKLLMRSGIYNSKYQFEMTKKNSTKIKFKLLGEQLLDKLNVDEIQVK